MGDGRLDTHSMRSCQDEGQQSVAKNSSFPNSYNKSHNGKQTQTKQAKLSQV